MGFMTESTNICIYFCDTGGGHGSAAQAIKAGIEAVVKNGTNEDINIICQPLIDQSHLFIGPLISFYNYLARNQPTCVKYYYHLLHLFQMESNLYYGLYHSYLHDLLETHKPSLIVSVHPMITEALVHARDQVKMESAVKIAVVVTDPNDALWRAWACKRADFFIAGNQIVKSRLVDWGIEPDKIQVLGMPIHPDFLSPPSVSPKQFLSNLNLSGDVFTVCINSGWAGNPHLLEIYEALTKCKRKVQAIFLCGHNNHLYELAQKKAKQTIIPTAVLPFYSEMSNLMAAVNLMVTKAGGLTTYQALARRLPLVFDNTIEPMPMEAPTMRMLVDCDLAEKIDKPEDIVAIVDNSEFPHQIKPLPQIYELNLTDDAIFNIARSLLKLYDPEIISEHANAPIANIAPHK